MRNGHKFSAFTFGQEITLLLFINCSAENCRHNGSLVNKCYKEVHFFLINFFIQYWKSFSIDGNHFKVSLLLIVIDFKEKESHHSPKSFHSNLHWFIKILFYDNKKSSNQVGNEDKYRKRIFIQMKSETSSELIKQWQGWRKGNNIVYA